MKNNIVQSFDIETGGMIMGQHPLMAIGTSVFLHKSDGTFELLDSMEVHFPTDEKDYDPDTLLWWKSQDTWEQVREDPISLSEGAALLRDFNKKWQIEAIVNRKITYSILVDNAWYDSMWISWFLCKYAEGGYPLRKSYVPAYDKGGHMKITHVIDVNQRIQALADVGLTIGLKNLQYKTAHDHTPMHDSMGIAEKWFYYCARVKDMRKANLDTLEGPERRKSFQRDFSPSLAEARATAHRPTLCQRLAHSAFKVKNNNTRDNYNDEHNTSTICDTISSQSSRNKERTN